jgi:uncharacterized membrane protein
MNPKRILKLMATDIGLMAVNVVLYSKSLLGGLVGKSSILTAIAVLISLVTVVVFFYYNYKVLFSSSSESGYKSITGGAENASRNLLATTEEISGYLETGGLTFKDELMRLSSQLESLTDKGKYIRKSLGERFQPQELTYQKFDMAVSTVEDYMFQNAKGLIQRVNGFDESDYERTINDVTVDKEVTNRKRALRDEYGAAIKASLSAGEEVLGKLDKLKTELDKIATFDEKSAEDSGALEELDSVIGDIKFYRDELK